MELQDFATIGAILATVFSGINFVVISIAKTFWSLTYKKTEERLTKLESETNKDRAENEAFRHKYKATTESIYILLDSKFSDFDKHFQDFKELIETKIDLAVSRSQNDKK